MLKVEVISVGTRPPAWVQAGVDHYVARMGRKCRFAVREIKTSDRNTKMSTTAHKNAEAQLILKALRPSARVVALDAGGGNWSTGQLAANIARWSQQTSHLQFITGGPDGLAESVLGRADELWSLSALTFPHFLVRVLLCEQIYRALMLNANHPYPR